MKVLLLTHDFPPNPKGGEGVVAGQLAELLSNAGVELSVVTTCQEDSFGYDRHVAYAIRRVPVSGASFLTRIPQFFFSVRNIVLNYEGDLVYSWRPVPVRKGQVLVHHFHTTRYGEARGCYLSGNYFSAFANWVYGPTDRYMANVAHSIIVPSERMKDDLVAQTAVDSRSIKVLPNPVDIDFWGANISEIRSPLENSVRFLYAGRLDQRKGIHSLIEAFYRVVSEHHVSANLVLVGDGPGRKMLLQKVDKLALGGRVILAGRLDRSGLRQQFAESHVLFVPSLYEPFGLVIPEAIASGLPVVSSDVCAKFGQRCFPPGNVDEIENIMLEAAMNYQEFRDKNLVSLSQLDQLRPSSVVEELQSIFCEASLEAS